MEARHWIELVSLWTPFRAAFAWGWGAGDAVWLMVLKRVFLLLPIGSVCMGYWASVLSLPTIVVRSRRRTFVSLMLVGGSGRGYYNVTGTLEADGSIHGRLTRRGPTEPSYYDFTGKRDAS